MHEWRRVTCKTEAEVFAAIEEEERQHREYLRNAPYYRPGPLRHVIDGMDVTDIGIEGTIASAVGPVEDRAYLARMLRQVERDFVEMGCGSRPYWVERALYQQLVGRWTAEDDRWLTNQISMTVTSVRLLDGGGGGDEAIELEIREDRGRYDVLP